MDAWLVDEGDSSSQRGVEESSRIRKKGSSRDSVQRDEVESLISREEWSCEELVDYGGTLQHQTIKHIKV